jgi:colanic acid/amylovoran/stewartan biosynthesis glycosyltransferase WcaL/AmsK/CpsK
VATGRFVLEALERHPVSVVHAHFGMAGAQIAAAIEQRPPALVTTFYGVDASACLVDPRWRERFAGLWPAGDAFVVLSEQVVPRLVAAGAPEERIHVWNIGIDFAPYRLRERRPDERPLRILCAARFVEKKGHEVLLAAFAQLRRELPAKLTLVGYGPLLPTLMQKIEALGIRDDVEAIDTSGRHDFTELFSTLLDRHDVFALPSTVARDGDDEGGPALTVVCAQAAGLPVVVTPFAGAERSVEHGVTGLLCEYDPGSLRDRLLELAADPARAAALGSTGAERVRNDFELESQRASLERIYSAAIDTKARRTT